MVALDLRDPSETVLNDSVTQAPPTLINRLLKSSKSNGTRHLLASLQADAKLLMINGKVYDVTSFAAEHPGGRVIETYFGQDATDVFTAFHDPQTVEVLANYYLCDLPDYSAPGSVILGESVPVAKDQSSFREEVEELRFELEEQGLFDANLLYYVFKVMFNYGILAASVYSLLAVKSVGFLNIIASGALLGLFWQQSGWLAHDFLHHQVMKNRSLNNAIGYILGNVGQGFSVEWWKDKHNTHHAKPNVHDVDPDIDTMPILGWSVHALQGLSKDNADLMTRFTLTYQHYLYFVILAFARLSWAHQSVLYAMNKSTRQSRQCEISSLAVHWLWVLAMTFEAYKQQGIVGGIVFQLMCQCTCGVLLALVFSLNHNGMPIYTDAELDQMDFYQLQVATGRNVHESIFNSWLTGGLNSQIEHHLFPRMPRHNFSKIRTRVRELCKKWDVDYHQTGIWDGTLEVLGRLEQISAHAQHLF